VAEQLEAGAVGQPEVDDREVRPPVLELAQAVAQALGERELVAVRRQVVGQEVRSTGSSSTRRILGASGELLMPPDRAA